MFSTVHGHDMHGTDTLYGYVLFLPSCMVVFCLNSVHMHTCSYSLARQTLALQGCEGLACETNVAKHYNNHTIFAVLCCQVQV